MDSAAERDRRSRRIRRFESYRPSGAGRRRRR